MGACYDKAVLLYRQKRYDMARQELARELAQYPQSAYAHALMALCMTFQGEFRNARATAEKAISLQPDLAFGHFSLAIVFSRDVKYQCRRGVILEINAAGLRRHCLRNAERAIREAIRLAPHEAYQYGVLALIRHDLQDFKGCLAIAHQGLAVNPADEDCLRSQALGLRALGKTPLAEAASREYVSLHPERVLSHVTHGQMLLAVGEFDRAREHFEEAMRLNPNLAAARKGLIESLQAEFLPYRIVLRMHANSRGNFRRQLQGLIVLCAMILIVVVPPIAVGAWSNKARLDSATAAFVTAIAALPAVLILFSGQWALLFLLFDRRRRRVLRPWDRAAAWVMSATAAVVYLYFILEVALPKRILLTTFQHLGQYVAVLAAAGVLATGICEAGRRR